MTELPITATAMGINNRPTIDSRWFFHHRAVARAFQLCTVTIYNEVLSTRTYDAATNTWSTSETAVWAGKARIQPTRSSTTPNTIGNATAVRQVEMQLDFRGNTLTGSGGAMTDIRPGNYIIVSDSPVDEQLKKFVYIVRAVVNSSNPWQRTLLCDVDMESDPDA